MILDDDLVSRVVFHPRTESGDCLTRGLATETRCDGAVVCGYLHENASSDSLLIFFHGNGEIAADYDLLSDIYTGCGVSFWVVDYRGYGRSTGSPRFSHMIKDAEAVLDDVPRLAETAGRRYARVLVMGRSLGSGPAIHLASTRNESLSGLILDSPYADGLALIRRLGGPMLAREGLPGFDDNLDKMRRCILPCLIIHGTNDRIIPVSDAEALHAACGSQVRELLKIRDAGHNDLLLVGLADYWRRLRDFIALTTGSGRTE